MFSLDFVTTLWLSTWVAAAFALGCGMMAATLGHHPAIRRLTLGNIALALSLGGRALFALHSETIDLAVVQSLQIAGGLCLVSALRHAAGNRSAARSGDRLLATFSVLATVLLFNLSWTSRSPDTISAVASLMLGLVMATGWRDAAALSGPALRRPRWVLQACFAMFVLYALAHLVDAAHLTGRDAATLGASALGCAAWMLLGVAINLGLMLTMCVRLAERVTRLANVDELTGLLNRRGMGATMIERRTGHSSEHADAGAIVLIDVDHFKQVNDTWGHAVGDRTLQWFAQRLRSFARVDDIVVRLGGEEFALVLPGCPADEARRVAQRICDAFAHHESRQDGAVAIRVTASFGVAKLSSGLADLERDLQHADDALYAAKRAGRSQVKMWDATTATAAA